MDVLKEALAKIKPVEDEIVQIDKRIKEFISRIKLKDAKIILGGSGAKDTWLKTTKDADIFIQFNYKKFKDKSDQLSDILEKQLKRSFKKVIRLHGSRDYFQVKEGSFTFEMVPILEINNSKDALNITDVSPLHAVFVKSAIKKNKKLADEIRLMKQFCKSNQVYGAESYIQGFSGYMCELLVISYGSFIKLIKAAAKWKEKEVIDIKNFYKGKNILIEMNRSKTHSPLILVDPVQADRNAAAALSYEKYNIFKEKAKEFLRKPSLKFFEEYEFKVDELKKEFIVVEADVLDGKEDIVGAKTLKVFEFLRNSLCKEGFDIIKEGWSWDKGKNAYFYFKISKELDKIETVRGPPSNIKEHAEAFKKKHKKTFVKNNIVYAKENRRFTKAKDFIRSILKDAYVKERIISAKIR